MVLSIDFKTTGLVSVQSLKAKRVVHRLSDPGDQGSLGPFGHEEGQPGISNLSHKWLYLLISYIWVL